MKKFIFLGIVIIILIVVIIIVVLVLGRKSPPPPPIINNFEECIAQGYPVLESYPRQCKTPDGKTFVEDIGNEIEKQDLIRINNPRPNALIKSPLEIEGEARGYWFFEANFSVRLIDENGKELGKAIAKTFSNWMTEDFVPFKTGLEFSKPETNLGTLILEKANPSGLLEYADALRVPVRFDLADEGDEDKEPISDCIRTGCTGQICSDQEVVTSCEFLPEYICYLTARCERQPDGNCGWTPTEELRDCLEKLKS